MLFRSGIATLSTEQDARLTVYFAPDITVKYMQSSARLRLGTLCGNVKNLELTGNALFILGQKIDSENNVEFTRLNYDLAEANIEPSATSGALLICFVFLAKAQIPVYAKVTPVVIKILNPL